MYFPVTNIRKVMFTHVPEYQFLQLPLCSEGTFAPVLDKPTKQNGKQLQNIV